MAQQQEKMLDGLTVRTFDAQDQAEVSHLYTEGLLERQIPPNDTGADIDNIFEAYLNDPSSHFWVAELDGQILGMIGVARDREHLAEIRRLRVNRDWQHTPIAERLIETALAHCREHGYVKVVLDTHFERDTVVDLFDRFGFQHTRTRTAGEKDLPEFYLDLYRQDKDQQQ